MTRILTCLVTAMKVQCELDQSGNPIMAWSTAKPARASIWSTERQGSCSVRREGKDALLPGLDIKPRKLKKRAASTKAPKPESVIRPSLNTLTISASYSQFCCAVSPTDPRSRLERSCASAEPFDIQAWPVSIVLRNSQFRLKSRRPCHSPRTAPGAGGLRRTAPSNIVRSPSINPSLPVPDSGMLSCTNTRPSIVRPATAGAGLFDLRCWYQA